MHDWRRLRRKIERRYGVKPSYFWVKEKTENGQRHIHMITDCAIDWRWLKDNYAEVTKGESFHIYVSEEPVAHSWGYVMKYMTKDLDSRTMWKYKERKYGFSHDFVGITGDQEWFTEYEKQNSAGQN
ncbi:MAG: hypothetical protein WAV05_08745 [Anaerolineales bacterium]